MNSQPHLRFAPSRCGQLFTLAVICVSSLVALANSVAAAEPYQKFLQRLREERLFDLALVYLDDVKNRPGVSEEFKTEFDLERALLYFQSASILSPKTPQRGEKLDQTDKFLRKFVAEHPQHPRRGEARLKLGGLLRMRAEEALALAGNNVEQGVPDAVKFFDAAHQLYEEAIKELAQIENSLKGARVDPQDRETVAYRNQVRLDLREAQLYSAKAIEDRGRSRPANDPQRKADLEKSLEMYADLYRKETSLAGIRTFALLYRSGVQSEMGLKDDAIDGLQRIVDLENIDQLRPVQTEALTDLIEILASQEKYQPAAERAEAWISKLRPDEREAPEVVALKLAYAKLRVEWIDKLKKADAGDRVASRLDKAVRSDLRELLRVPGPHVETARALLGSLGVDSGKAKITTELPPVKNLTEALEESQKRMEDADNEAISLAVLEEQINDPGLAADEKTKLVEQRDEQLENTNLLRRAALDLLHIGLEKYDGKKDDRTQLFNARFRLAYLLLKLKETREAIVVSEFLSRTSPGTSQGLNASSIVLQGFSELLQRPNADHAAVMNELAPFAEFLVATWPQSAEAVAASGALTQLAVVSQNWDQAEKYLQAIPSSSPGIGRQYFDLGAALFDQYQKLLRDSSADTAATGALRDRAAKWLQLAHDQIDANDSSRALAATNALAQLKLSQDLIDDAANLMLNGEKAPMKWIDGKLDAISPAAAMDAYRTAMRITAAQVVDGKVDATAAAKSMQTYVDKLQQVGSATDEGQQRLQGIFTAIAADLKEKLELVPSASKKAELSQVVLLVVREAAKSDSFNTKNWAAATLINIAQGLEDKGKATEASEKAYGEAATLLSEMLTRAQGEPAWVPAGSINSLRILKAKASDGTKDYRGAIEAYAEILDENDAYIDVQMDVARTLQNAGLFKAAISGARPNPKTKRNVFWGWGRIGQEAQSRVRDFPDQFYEARFQLANARYQYALTLANNPAAKDKELNGAAKSIKDTHALYPEMGGPTFQKRFDALLKQIQKELGQPESGLAG